MTKLFKKSLALLLTLALCLSAMACCFLVSAEGETTPAGSISFVLNDEGDINPGDDVIIDVVANWTGVAGAEFTVTGIPAEAKVKTTNTEVVINHDAAAATVKFVDGNNAELANGVLFSISFTAGEKDTTYTFEIDKDTAVFCNLNEEDVTVTSEATSFTVVEKVVEPEVPACEHEWEVVTATPATTEADGSVTLDCKKCDEADGTVEDVKYNRYSRPIYTGLLLESELIYTQSVRYVQDLTRVGSDDSWSDLYLQFVETKADGSNSIALVNYSKAEQTIVSGKECYKFSYGVASTGLVNSITSYAYTYNATDKQWYSGETTTESVVSYAKQLLPTATPLQKTLFVDVLNYGAAAQMAFNYATDNLANADLIIEGVDYSAYGTAGDVAATNNSKAASSSTVEYPVTVPSFGAECESRLILNVEFQFGKSYYQSYINEYDGLYVEISYTNVFGEDRVVRYYNSSVSDDDYTFTQIEGNDRRFRFAFNDFCAGDMRNTITFKVYTADGVLLNSESTYCIEDYVALNRSNSSTSAKILTLVNEMLQFGDSANAFILSAN